MIKRIGIVFRGYYLGFSVQVVETAKALAKHGFLVDIFIDEAAYAASPIEFAEPNIKLVVLQAKQASSFQSPLLLPAPGSLGRLFHRLKLSTFAYAHWLLPFTPALGSPKDFYLTYAARMRPFLNQIAEFASDKEYVALIGVEPAGLIAAHCVMMFLNQTRCRLLYYNMELLQHTRSMSSGVHLKKHVEILISKECLFTVIADEYRGKVYAKANGLEMNRIRCLPVSTSGQPIRSKGNYLQKRFNLSPDVKIVLYAGNVLARWAMCYEIVESVSNWPENYVLVLHTWKSSAAEDPHFQEMVRIAPPGRVFFSTQPVSPDELPELLSSADIGLAFYQPEDANDANQAEIGSSSNKLAQYARVGLPVIASNLPSIQRIFDRFHCGVCLNTPAQIGTALEPLFQNYARFREGAFESYVRHYEFSAGFEPILAELLQMT